MLSRLGPAIAHADVNRDGLQDVFLGGARGQKSSLFLQQLDGSFLEGTVPAFESDADHEDVDAAFFDVDNDGDLDLYVTSGGNDEEDGHPIYQDRLYINNGFGAFSDQTRSLPEMYTSTGTVAPHDFDQDGDIDLFVGGRTTPGKYPTAPRSYLLENVQGIFSDVTDSLASPLVSPGMITNAAWGALTQNDQQELILVGEWMPPRVFRFTADTGFSEATDITGLENHIGWWNTLLLDDIDADGDLDILAGNKGLNSGLSPTSEHPISLFSSDMDGNGKQDAIILSALKDTLHTIYWRNEVVQQIPGWQFVFPDQTSYARATFDDISALIPPDALEYIANDFSTRLFENDGSGAFTTVQLPRKTQTSPVQSFIVRDFDGNGHKDILIAGNNFATRAEWGRDNAGQGLLLLGKPGMAFDVLTPESFGLRLDGDIRSLVALPGENRIIVAQNNGPTRLITSIPPLQVP